MEILTNTALFTSYTHSHDVLHLVIRMINRFYMYRLIIGKMKFCRSLISLSAPKFIVYEYMFEITPINAKIAITATKTTPNAKIILVL